MLIHFEWFWSQYAYEFWEGESVAQRLFRVFLSSTFSDFAEERSILQQRVWPLLDEFARSKGARFEAIDLRWGISSEAQHSNETIDICLSEIARSQRLSPRPNFIILLGQRYGWEPVPGKIGDHSWQSLCKVATDLEKTLLLACFECDENAMPEPIWMLKPSTEWSYGDTWISEASLLELVRKLVTRADLESGERAPYFMSATHLEIAAGALAVADADEHVCVYIRKISDLNSLLDRYLFLDIDDSGSEPPGVAGRLSDLHEQIRESGNAAVLRDYSVQWMDVKRRRAYLEKFATEVLRDQMALIERALSDRESDFDEDQVERGNREFSASRSSLLIDRDLEVQEIVRHCSEISGNQMRHPFWVFGIGGVGKSAVLAAAALKLAKQPGIRVMVRHIGAVPGGETLPLLCRSLAPDFVFPKETLAGFRSLLQSLAAEPSTDAEQVQVVIFLDGIDQLDPSEGAHELTWIPKDLPDRVRLVISTRSGRIEERARAAFPESPSLTVKPLGRAAGEEILNRKLAERERTLTPDQREAVLEAFMLSGQDPLDRDAESGGSPLWIVLAASLVAGLRSFDRVPVLPVTVVGLIHRLVYRLSTARKHGRRLTQQGMALIAASRGGLSDDEVLAALSNDRSVRSEFESRAHQHWNHQQLPSIVWLRLRADLEPYLTEVISEATLVSHFFHREFADYVLDRLVNVDTYEDVALHCNLFEVLAFPHSRHNWRHVIKGQPQDPRVLRALGQRMWHGKRSLLGAFGRNKTTPACAVLNTEASLFSFTQNHTPDSIHPGITEKDFADWLLCFAALEHGDCESMLIRNSGDDTLIRNGPEYAFWFAGEDRPWQLLTKSEHPYLSNLGFELAGLIDSEGPALVAATIDGHPTLVEAQDSWIASPASSSRSLRLGLLAWAQDDPMKAERLWAQAAELGNRDAIEMLLRSMSAEKRGDDVLELLKHAVSLGLADQFGDRFLQALEAASDPERLANWQELVDACKNLASTGAQSGPVAPEYELDPDDAEPYPVEALVRMAHEKFRAVMLGEVHDNEERVHIMTEAYELWERAAGLGSHNALYQLGYADTRADWHGLSNWERGLARWQEAARAGHEIAMYDLGSWALARGQLPTRREIAWLRRARDIGFNEAAETLRGAAYRICELATAFHSWSQHVSVATVRNSLDVRVRDGIDEVLLSWIDSLLGATEDAHHRWDSTNDGADFFAHFPFPRGELCHRLGVPLPAEDAEFDRPDPAIPIRQATWCSEALHYEQGRLAEARGDTEAAILDYTGAAVRGNREAMYRLGILAFRHGDPLGAQTWWERGAALDDLPSVLTLATVAQERGDVDGARAWETFAETLGWPYGISENPNAQALRSHSAT